MIASELIVITLLIIYSICLTWMWAVAHAEVKDRASALNTEYLACQRDRNVACEKFDSLLAHLNAICLIAEDADQAAERTEFTHRYETPLSELNARIMQTQDHDVF